MKLKVFVAGVFLLLFVCACPASAAVQDNSIGVTYIVTPLVFGDGDVLEPLASTTSSVTQGETERFKHYVALGSTELNVQVSWNLPPNYNSLSLRITNPDTITVIECSDTFESPIPNGIIPVNIVSPSGLPSGYWIFDVIGIDVLGIQTFTLSTSSG